jgi:hypothetical protein
MAPKNFKNPFINRAVILAPKTYALEILDEDDESLSYYKVVCKGFEPSYDNSKAINFESFLELVFTKYGLNAFFNGKRGRVEEREFIQGAKRLTFKSSIHGNSITPVECYVQKNMSGDYTKGEVHPEDPRFIIPFSPVSKFVPPPGSFLTSNNHYE